MHLPQGRLRVNSRGGGERDRTDGLLLAKQALSQLSYTPVKLQKEQPEESGDVWWAWMELNHRPHAYQACALTGLSYRPSKRGNRSSRPVAVRGQRLPLTISAENSLR